MRQRALGRVDDVLDIIANAALALSSVMMVVLIVIFGWLVFGRYVLNATPTWVEQLALLLVVWITFLGAAVGIRNRAHLSVEFIRDALPLPARTLFIVFVAVVLAAFGAIMMWQGWVMYERTARRMVPLLGISEGLRAVPVILGGGLIALFSLADLATMAAGRLRAGSGDAGIAPTLEQDGA